MAGGSKRYADLARRLSDLRRNLLPFLPPATAKSRAAVISRTSYTPQELDQTRAYVLLAHAEIEAFCEDLVTVKVQGARRAFDTLGRVTPALRRLIAYYVCKEKKSWSEVVRPSGLTVNSACQSHLSTIEGNHGVKRQNIEKLFYPVGIVERQLGATWLAEMDSFGSNRGGWAHRSIKVLTVPDPASEAAAVENLLVGLLDLDRKMGKIR